LMTMMAQNKVRIDGHYEVKTLEPITDYAWVPGEEFVEGWQRRMNCFTPGVGRMSGTAWKRSRLPSSTTGSRFAHYRHDSQTIDTI
jgi:hypothetical protein